LGAHPGRSARAGAGHAAVGVLSDAQSLAPRRLAAVRRGAVGLRALVNPHAYPALTCALPRCRYRAPVPGTVYSFPVCADEHLLQVCRYVVRNALRAGLVARAEAWPS